MTTFAARQAAPVPMSEAALPELDMSQAPWPGQRVDAGGMELYVRSTPGPGAGPPDAVYVHGLGGSSTNWTDLAAQLSGHVNGHAVDLPGFGRSEPERGWTYTPEAQARAVVAYLEHLGGAAVHLFGNSLGGLTAALVAARRPDLVRTLTLVSPAVPDRRPDLRRVSDPRMALAMLPVVGRPVRRRMARATDRERAMALIKLVFAEYACVPEHRIAEAEIEATERAAMPWANSALARASLGMFRAWNTLGARSVWSTLRRVRAPVLVVWGAEDRLVTVRKAPRVARELPRGRLFVLPRTGHVAQMERPVEVARAVLGMCESVAAGTW